MIHASLFSGIGGPEVAAAMMGWENAFHCEINPFGRAVLDYWFPNSKSYEDITKTDFREWRGKIDILTGGFPCQPFSYAGKRGGREDERYLWPEMLRVIDEVRPTWVVGENVAGITTMVEGGVLTPMGSNATLFGEGDGLHRYELRQSFTIERICRDLEGLGYSVQPVLVPAAAVGAPHRRDRIFICAHRDTDCGHALGEVGKVQGKQSSHTSGIRKEFQRDVAHSDVGGGSPQGADSAGDRPGADILPGKARQGKGYAPVGTDGLSPIQGTAQDTVGDGCGIGEHDIEGRVRDFGNSGAGDDERVCGEKRIHASDPEGWRGGEVPSEIHTGQPDGDKPFSDGRERDVTDTDRPGLQEARAELQTAGNRRGGEKDVADPYGEGREESQQPGRGEDSEEEGEGMDDRAERSGRNGVFALPGLLPENRWDNFPTVSPVHRGNDGIPFPVDCLTVPPIPKPPTYGKGDPKQYPFGKWRTEALKAYGNAIVPQVMYRIFQAIEQVEDGQQD